MVLRHALKRNVPIVCLLVLGVLFGCQSREPQTRCAGDSCSAGQPPRRTSRDRLRGFHRSDRCGPIGEHGRAGDRLPGADALRRKGRKSRRESCCSRSTPNPTKPRCAWAKPRWPPTRPNSSSPSKNYERVQVLSKEKGVSQQEFDQYKAALGSGGRAARRCPGEPGNLPAEPAIHPRHFPHRWAGQPLLPDAGQPDQPGSDAAHHRRVARPDLRLFRCGPAQPAADSPSNQ